MGHWTRSSSRKNNFGSQFEGGMGHHGRGRVTLLVQTLADQEALRDECLSVPVSFLPSPFPLYPLHPHRHSCCVFMIPTAMSYPEDSSPSYSSPSFGSHNPCTSLSRCSSSLRGGHINVPFEFKYSAVPYSHRFDQSWVPLGLQPTPL